jgi:hypothetical protein
MAGSKQLEYAYMGHKRVARNNGDTPTPADMDYVVYCLGSLLLLGHFSKILY